MSAGAVTPQQLRFEHLDRPALGIGSAKPRISWSFPEVDREWTQEAYELQISYPDGTSDSHFEHSSQNVLLPWPFRALKSREAVELRVRTLGRNETEYSPWSEQESLEAGLLNPQDWELSFIEPSFPTFDQVTGHRPVVFQRKFNTPKPPVSARLYITSHGVYHGTLNGSVIGDQVLAPGWTSYGHRLLYQTYDITSLLRSDTNVLQVTVAEGWYCGRLGWGKGQHNIYGDKLGMVAYLVLDFDGGETMEIRTDREWTCSTGPFTKAGLYDGQTEDLRIVPAADRPVSVQTYPHVIQAPLGSPVRATQELKPQQKLKSPSEKLLLDFGQNFVGRLRVRLSGNAGHKVTFRHAEVLEHGELGIRPLRCAKATDMVITGEGSVVWEPVFAIHGFRYVEVEGWPGDLQLDDITGVVVHTDMERTGTFDCSSPMLNQLHKNIVWSMRSNFVSIPTDCPQRDERLGWTGDINVFADTASYLYDTSGILASWLDDVRDEQKQSDGIVPLTVPNVIPGLEKEPHAIWGDVIIMLPWALYKAYGDLEILARYYDGMKKWLAAITRSDTGLWDYQSRWKLGDWLDPLAPPEDPGNGITDPTLVANSFLIHSVDLMAQIATILGEHVDAKIYNDQRQRFRRSFVQEYVTPAGQVLSDSQTAYVLAVHFRLLENDQQYQRAAKRLEYLAKEKSRFTIGTGFAGTPYVGHAMSASGLTQLFYRMLLHPKCPSWLYPITLGATTVWERWDSMLPNGSVNPGEMTSFNHYALGSVADWLHSYTIGLKPIEPGWKTFSVEPTPGGGLLWAQGSFRSGHGMIHVFWRIDPSTANSSATFYLRVRAPANTTAVVRLPGQSETQEKKSGLHEWKIDYQHETDWAPKAVFPPSLIPDDDLLDEEPLPAPF